MQTSHSLSRLLRGWPLVLVWSAGCAISADPPEPAEQDPLPHGAALATAERLRDFSQVKTNGPSMPRGFAVVGGKALFFATDRAALYATDGTAAGTRLVRDLTQPFDSSTPSIVAFGGQGYWGQSGALWRSDGTGAGTEAVKIFGNLAGDTPTTPVVYDGALYFGATDAMWKSDGTAAGTQLLANLEASGRWQEMGGKLYFACATAAAGRELCVSDGTAAGTSMLRDLQPGIQSADPKFLGVVGTQLLFSALLPRTPVLQRYLWTTDGTSAGTRQLVAPGGAGIELGEYAEPVEVLGGFAYFPCYTAATGFELCRSDGTPAGTSLLDLTAGTGSSGITSYRALGSRLYFSNTMQGAGRELWSTNGTVAGTSMLIDLLPGIFDGLPFSELVVMGGALYFAAHSSLGDPVELWKTDGTAAGTVRVKAILPAGKPQSYPLNLFEAIALGQKLVFPADDGTASLEPWVSDGTAAGTALLQDLEAARTDARMFEIRALQGKQYLTVQDGQAGSLWRTDGTAAGTGSVQAGSFILSAPVTTPSKQWLFYGSNGTGDGALWKTDGTGNGAGNAGDAGDTGIRVRDLPGQVHELLALGDKAVFAGTTPNLGYGLWLSDGTEVGTALASPSVLNAKNLGVANGKLWLAGLLGGDGNELWTSDGTDAGTKPVKDLRAGSGSSDPREFVELGGLTLFTANDGISGRELWKTDGTAAGTVRVIDLLPGSGSSGPSRLLPWKNLVLFSAVSSSPGSVELWKTDGTAAGTSRLTTAIPVSQLVAWGDHIFFAATDAAGTELWRSDGTAAGTVRVSDGYPGPLSSNPNSLLLAGPAGPLVFVAEAAATGREVWQLAQPMGTPELLIDLAPGERSSQPRSSAVSFAVQGSSLLVAADVGAGSALWRLDGVGSDGVAPVLSCPAAIVKRTSSSDGVAVIYPPPTVTDSSLIAPVVTADWPSGTKFPLGVTTVTVTAVDGSNNVSKCTFSVEVQQGADEPKPDPEEPELPEEPGKPGRGGDSGGCSAAGVASPGSALVLLLGLVLVRRRRRA